MRKLFLKKVKIRILMSLRMLSFQLMVIYDAYNLINRRETSLIWKCRENDTNFKSNEG